MEKDLIFHFKVEEELIENIDVVVDATGTYGNNNFVGEGGLPALGERSLKVGQNVTYTIPDLLKDSETYAGANSQIPKYVNLIINLI